MSWCRELLAAAALAAALEGHGAELTWGGSAAARLELLTNPSLTVPDSAGAWRFTQSVSADVRRSTEAWDAAADGALGINESNQQRLNTVDGSLGARFTRRFERGNAGLAAGLRRDSTQASEFQATGIVLTRAQRDSSSFSATGLYQFDERWSANLAGSLAASRYDRSGGASGLVDTDTRSASAGINYAAGPVTRLGVTATLSRFDSQPFTTASRSASVQATLLHEFSDRLSLNAAYGPSRTHTDIAALARICPLQQILCDTGSVPFTVFPTRTAQRTDGYLYNLTALYQAGPESRLSLGAGRAASASGTGFLVVTDSVAGSLSHRLNDRLSLSLEAGTTRADSIVTALQLRSQRLSASVGWQLAEDWTLEGGLRWQRAEYADGRAPESAAVFAGIRYNLPRQRVTRW